MARISEQTSRLVREELRLAQGRAGRERQAAGIGVELIGGAGVFSRCGVGALGRRRYPRAQATPPLPAGAVDGINQDVQTLKSGSNA